MGVDAEIEYKGLAPDGTMATTKGFDDVAWFKLGPRPGDPGNAVIAGHSGWGKGKAAIFNNLSRLRPGDKLYVSDDRGVTATFVMRRSQDYRQSESPVSVFRSVSARPHLNLITCEGVWNSRTKSYSGRLVVFADED